MDGITVGVFGTDQEAKAVFESSVAKKSEAEGITVYARTDAGRRYSLLDTSDYPDRIQGYARIASIVDHALYFFPTSGKLSPRDGELAVLLSSLGIPGTLELLNNTTAPDQAKSSLRGTTVADYTVDERQAQSAAVDLSHALPRVDFPTGTPCLRGQGVHSQGSRNSCPRFRTFGKFVHSRPAPACSRY
ncbi:MAG: hypothetical protein OK452_03485 [Thaumarchaeota archaeon]|nr:hypothetical protein [Nitrososphaerota archaeon]